MYHKLTATTFATEGPSGAGTFSRTATIRVGSIIMLALPLAVSRRQLASWSSQRNRGRDGEHGDPRRWPGRPEGFKTAPELDDDGDGRPAGGSLAQERPNERRPVPPGLVPAPDDASPDVGD
jgi:hypothetical protein